MTINYSFSFLCVVLLLSISVADKNGDPKKTPVNDNKSVNTGMQCSRDDIVAKFGGEMPEKLSLEQFEELHRYWDREEATTDMFPKPEDAQNTPQKSDLTVDLGAKYDKCLVDQLTKGKKFNPLVIDAKV